MEKETKHQCDTFICGGGIAGLLTAYALGKKGRKIVVAEKNSAFNPNGADVLKPSGLEVLERLGLYGFLSEYGAVKRDRVIIYHGGEFLAEMDYAFEHERKYFMLIPYKNVLNMLLDRIREMENIHILFNTELTSLKLHETSNDIASVTLNNNLVLEAKVYIAADGITSKFRSLMGVNSEIEKYTQQMYFAQFPMVDSVNDCNRLYVDKNHLLAYFYPVGVDQFRCVLGFSKEEGDILFRNKDVQQLKNRLLSFVSNSDDAIEAINSFEKFVTFPLCRMNIDKYYKANLVFVGNAAHSIHPITGQGMNLAIEDAGALYPLLEAFFDGTISLKEGFENYQKIRHNINTRLINYGHHLINSFDDRKMFAERLNLTLQTSNRTF